MQVQKHSNIQISKCTIGRRKSFHGRCIYFPRDTNYTILTNINNRKSRDIIDVDIETYDDENVEAVIIHLIPEKEDPKIIFNNPNDKNDFIVALKSFHGIKVRKHLS